MHISAPEPLLEVRDLHSGHGKIRVLHGVDMTIGAGEAVALLGPNGAGKTTLLCAIAGLLSLSGGSVRFGGKDISGSGPRETTRAGLVHVIQGHRVFTQISVADNLLLAGYDLPRGERSARVEEALSFFPEIAEKRHDRAGALSGGQQQMLAVAQGLVRRPRLLMLDEPSAGLSPVLVDRVLSVARSLRERGTFRPAGRAADREGAGSCRPRLRAGARANRAGGVDGGARPAAPVGARLFRPGRALADPLIRKGVSGMDTTIASVSTSLLRVPWAGDPPANGIMPPAHREFLVLEIGTRGGLSGMGYLQPLSGGLEALDGCMRTMIAPKLLGASAPRAEPANSELRRPRAIGRTSRSTREGIRQAGRPRCGELQRPQPALRLPDQRGGSGCLDLEAFRGVPAQEPGHAARLRAPG